MDSYIIIQELNKLLGHVTILPLDASILLQPILENVFISINKSINFYSHLKEDLPLIWTN